MRSFHVGCAAACLAILLGEHCRQMQAAEQQQDQLCMQKSVV